MNLVVKETIAGDENTLTPETGSGIILLRVTLQAAAQCDGKPEE